MPASRHFRSVPPTLILASLFLVLSGCRRSPISDQGVILNVSYDPTRELYDAENQQFVKNWQNSKGESITIRQSHGGSSKQARSVIDGLQADVVTLALAADIDAIASRSGLIDPNWQKRLPNNSCPYTSTIVFLVRKGNPKGINDWDDLVRNGVSIITPNPKTSGGARWNYLAAYGYALKKNQGDTSLAKDFMRKLFANVPVLDSGARGATLTFLQRGIGDVLIAWESEALMARNQTGKDAVEIIYPSLSILAEPAVAVVDGNVKRHHTGQVSLAYLQFLYSEQGQEICARHFFRPSNPAALARHKADFPAIQMLRIDSDFGGWSKAQKEHFGDGGTFDQVARQE
jgi:sulfate transport system substrate-binding protein